MVFGTRHSGSAASAARATRWNRDPPPAPQPKEVCADQAAPLPGGANLSVYNLGVVSSPDHQAPLSSSSAQRWAEPQGISDVSSELAVDGACDAASLARSQAAFTQRIRYLRSATHPTRQRLKALPEAHLSREDQQHSRTSRYQRPTFPATASTALLAAFIFRRQCLMATAIGTVSVAAPSSVPVTSPIRHHL